MGKLFRVRVEHHYELMVVAENASEARHIAEDAVEHYSESCGERQEFLHASEFDKSTALPDGWTPDALPFMADDDDDERTIADFLAEAKP